MALAARLRHADYVGDVSKLEAITFVEPLELGHQEPHLVCEMMLDKGSMEIRTRDSSEDPKVLCVIGESSIAPRSETWPQGEALCELKKRCSCKINGITERYAALQSQGFHGPQFQTVQQVWLSPSGSEALAQITAPEEGHLYHLHPAMLDGVFQTVGVVFDADAWMGAATCLAPTTIRHIRLRGRL